jgi:hypothetical protein
MLEAQRLAHGEISLELDGMHWMHRRIVLGIGETCIHTSHLSHVDRGSTACWLGDHSCLGHTHQKRRPQSPLFDRRVYLVEQPLAIG